MSADLSAGCVVLYPYLWRWQKDRDETAGRKERPVCVIAAVQSSDGLTHLALLAISSRPPDRDQAAVEVPEMECKRAGLSEFKRAWVTVSEYNYDVAERSFHLDPRQPALGRFGRSFLRELAAAAGPLFEGRRARIDRTD